MNRAFVIIGVPAVGVAAFYAAVLWGRWIATAVAIGLALILWIVARLDSRHRASRAPASGRNRSTVAR